MLTMQLQLASRWRFCSSLSRARDWTKLTSEIKRGVREGSRSGREKNIQTWKTKWGILFFKRPPQTVYFSLFGSHEYPCVLTRSNSTRLIATYNGKQKVRCGQSTVACFISIGERLVFIFQRLPAVWSFSLVYILYLRLCIQVFCVGNT